MTDTDTDTARVLGRLSHQQAVWLGHRLPRPLVFTTAVFALPHAGRVDCLDPARRLGRTLVVALNTDAAVRRLQRDTGQPFQAHEQRRYADALTAWSVGALRNQRSLSRLPIAQSLVIAAGLAATMLLERDWLYAQRWRLQRQQQEVAQLNRRLARRPINLARLVASVVDGLHASFEPRGVQLHSDINLANARVVGDPSELAQVL